jgi:hypothetical protein
MSNGKSTTRKKSATPDLQTAYMDYLLSEGKRPASVYKFCKQLGIKETDFYAQAGSFAALEGLIWNRFISDVLQRLQASEEFAGFSSREKLLTFCFALFEELKMHRSFVQFTTAVRPTAPVIPAYLRPFRKTFLSFIHDLLSKGKQQGEIAARPYLEKTYPELFWLHLSFLLLFWLNDNSPDFEETDAAIEKSVNLAFELIGKGAVDAALDFARFLYQRSMN